MTTVFSALSLICLLWADTSSEVSQRGTVQDPEGKPIAGARVDIASAAPRVGQGMFCPSAYPDCMKWTRSDDQGRFEIRGLNPSLKFTVLVTLPNKKAHLSKLLDPLLGDVKIVLQPVPIDFPREQTVQGQIVDDRGQAIAGALIEPSGAQTANRRWFGLTKEVDPTASDSEGRFSLLLPKEYQGVDVIITAPKFAGARFELLKPNSDPHRLVVPAGTRVVGRLVHAGQPIMGVRVAVVQMNRRGGDHFIQAVAAVTDKAGKFAFNHLPASQDYAIFTVLGEGPQKLVLTTKKFKAHDNREERNLGDLELTAPKRIAGRLELPPGQDLPPNTKIALGHDPAWDLVEFAVNKDGTFVLDSLPPNETYKLRIAAKGLAIDGKGMPYQMIGQQGFGVRLLDSIENLRIPMVRSELSRDDDY